MKIKLIANIQILTNDMGSDIMQINASWRMHKNTKNNNDSRKKLMKEERHTLQEAQAAKAGSY